MNQLLSNIGLISYASAAIAFALLCLTVVFSPLEKPHKPAALCAAIASALWAALIAGGTLLDYPPLKAISAAEIMRNGAWIFFLLQMASMQSSGDARKLGERSWLTLFATGIAAVVFLQLLLPALAPVVGLGTGVVTEVEFITWLGLAIVGVILLEQLFRNSQESSRWSLKFLFIGLGCVYAYDIYLYSSALLLKRMDAQLWQARGFVNAIAAPLLGLAMARYSNWKLQFEPSRQVVFHSLALSVTGVYLLAMALAGYFIKYIGGDWGGVLQVSFLVAATAVLLALLFSGQIRARTRIFLNKHFFKYKYEYRSEWLNFTQTLASSSQNAPQGIVQAMASLVDSPGGLLWAKDDTGKFDLACHWLMPAPDIGSDIAPVANWLGQQAWIIDLDEYSSNPGAYVDLAIPAWLTSIDTAWLIIPLTLEQSVAGVLLLRRPDLSRPLNWEDRDLLKTAGSQAASHLLQYQATQELVKARQFEAFNRLSAYVVHDLKNILAQQSLMVANAQKHRDNPEFIDDMIKLMDNSVARMTALMDQMRSGMRGGEHTTLELASVLEKVVSGRAKQSPIPELAVLDSDVCVHSDAPRLSTVFDHLIQNAQDATRKEGSVKIRLSRENNTAVAEIEDNGIGMDDEFLANRLFRPFDSTKGLTGMGIGAFESREFIRSLGGDILVTSAPGTGSLFRVTLPCSPPGTTNTD